MTGYTKLFGSIVTSTIWREDDKTRIVWITLLALSDRDGVVEGSVPGLAHVAGVTIEDCERALINLQKPDRYSRSPEYEGRRVDAVDGGWRILNYGKYRSRMSLEDIRERNRIRKQRWRENQKGGSGCDTGGTCCDEAGPDGTTVTSHAGHGIAESIKQLKDISSNPSGLDDRTPVFADTRTADLDAALQTVWVYYLEKVGRNPKTYSLTTTRKRKGLTRLQECLKKTAGDMEAAANLRKVCVDALAKSDWHMGRDSKTGGKRFVEWDEHLFKSYECMERWWNV
jgi:hypothetical protein